MGTDSDPEPQNHLPSMARTRSIARINRRMRKEWEYAEGRRKRAPKPEKDFVYVICSDARFYKIGIAQDVQSRLADLQVVSPHRLELVRAFATSHPRRAETYLHKRFAEFRVQGEWFELPSETLAWLVAIDSLDDLPRIDIDLPEQIAIRAILTPSLFRHLYHDRGFTLEEIADRFGTSRQFIGRLRADYGIERAPRKSN